MILEPNPYEPYIRDEVPEAIPSDQIALFVPKYNSPGKHDATGAFHLEAINFCKRWDVPREKISYIDNRLAKSVHRSPNRADDLLLKMEKAQEESQHPIAIWVFLCHGYTHGIQFSIRSRCHPYSDDKYEEAYQRFVTILSEHPSPLCIFYACSTGDDPDGDPDTAPGSGDNSFGDLLRDDLCRKGAIYNRVMTHTTAGPATFNPFIKLLDGDGMAEGGIGGELIANPGTREFGRLRRLLQTDFRFEFPFLTLDAIRNAL